MIIRSPYWLLVCIAFTSGMATAQETPKTTSEEAQRKLWMAVYAEEATKYEMFRGSDEAEELELFPTPVLTFTNPVRARDTHGAAYIWTSDGRPEVIGAIWSVISPEDSSKRHLSLEFHSLSLVPIRSKHEPRISKRGAIPNWMTNEAGIERRKIPDAKPPVTVASRRLTQMRRLARQFEAKIPPGLADGEGSLRLLAQPLHRYRSERHHVIDGGIFAFVMGTDPEIILLIEAVESGDNVEWQFAAAPFSNLPMRLNFDGEQVWECPRSPAFVTGRPHFLYWAVSVRDRMIEDSP